jgi:hypothetical protein
MMDAARLRITLADIDPAPWREIEVPLSMSLKSLHDAIQAAFLWQDSHLWEFDIDGKRYGLPYDDDLGSDRVHKASTTKLTRLRDQAVTQFIYTYDMGDSWEHVTEVLQLFEAETGARLPRFIAGEHRAPPEDVGGPSGFEVFLKAINNPRHPEHRHFKDWYGEAFDPADIEEETIRALLGRLAKARPKKV